MANHDRLHRRHARAAWPLPDPEAIASALAEPLPGPNPFASAEPEAKAAQTLVSVVYVTAEPTFDGPIGGYKTLGPDDEEDTPTSTAKSTTEEAKKTTRAPEPITTTKKKDDEGKSSIVADTSEIRSKESTKATTFATSTGLPSAISSPKTTLTSSLAVLAATSSISGTETSSSQSSATVASSESTSSSSAKPTAEGMSAGGKAGLAIGILLLIGAILAIVLFVFKRRKEAAKKERLEDEKATMFASNGRAASTRTTATAPRLSLRPVTQFLPNLGGEKRSSRGNALLTAGAAASAPRATTPSQEQNRNNPFGIHAEAIDATNAKGPAPIQEEIVIATAAGAAAGATAGLARGASKRGNGPKPMDFTTKGPFMGPPSPAGTEFSQSSDSASTPTPSGTGAAIAAAGGPVNTAVHRVQLDFKPSMEDELELRAGQLIRVLHEYDDGWALCIRLDRSQQGVAPRTCLSTRPVKPRPQQGGPRGPPPGQRGPGPQGQMRAMSPAMNGPPRGSPGMNQGPRPASPGGRNSPGPQYNAQRPMTPQGQGRSRSPSVAQQQTRRNSPPGPSPMKPQAAPAALPAMGSSPPNSIGRKPVPGQAL